MQSGFTVTTAKKIFWRSGTNLSNYRSVIIIRTISAFEDKYDLACTKSAGVRKALRANKWKRAVSGSEYP